MTVGSWFNSVVTTVEKDLGVDPAGISLWFSTEEAALLNFFVPLMKQVMASAEQLGKDDLAVGIQILKDAAIAAVTSAAVAPPGAQVAAAETAFLATTATEGVVAIHNAEAGAIKAAVAIVQTNAGNTAALVANGVLTTAANTLNTKAGVK